MAQGDYISQAEALAAIGTPSAAQASELADVISAASRLIDRYLDRTIASASFDEDHEPGRSRAIRLREYPVSRVSRVSAGASALLTARCADATANRATAELTFSGDPPFTSAALTGLQLIAVRSGVATTTPLLFATYPTLTVLAAAIGAVSGWTATVATNYAAFATADLILEVGCRDARGSAATFWGHATDLSDYGLDPATGRLTLGAGWPLAAPTYAGWSDDTFRFPDRTWGVDHRHGSVRVSYTAGYATVPADLKRACVGVVQAILANEEISGIFRSEKAGTDAYELAADRRLIAGVEGLLAPHRRRSLA